MSRQPAHIFLKELDGEYDSEIREGFQWIGLGSRLRPGDTVFIKPNLTFPVYRKGVMTNPACVESLVRALKDYTDRIIVGEADSGGYNRFDIDSVFERTGLRRLERKYGIRVVNLSHLPQVSIDFQYKRRTFHVPFPRLLVEERDLFITVPVPKIHMNTGVSISIKNQWGCIPEPSARLKLHPFLAKVLYEINKRLQPALSVIDGRYGLNRTGPMLGDSVELNWLMVGDDLYAADYICCRIMGVNPHSIYYLRYLQAEEPPIRLEDLRFSRDYRAFVKHKFYLRRHWTDYPGLIAFRSPTIAHIAYHSSMSDFLHKVLYLVRKPFYDYAAPGQTRD